MSELTAKALDDLDAFLSDTSEDYETLRRELEASQAQAAMLRDALYPYFVCGFHISDDDAVSLYPRTEAALTATTESAEAHRKQIVNETLEWAASICDVRANNGSYDAECCAEEIRALKEKT